METRYQCPHGTVYNRDCQQCVDEFSAGSENPWTDYVERRRKHSKGKMCPHGMAWNACTICGDRTPPPLEQGDKVHQSIRRPACPHDVYLDRVCKICEEHEEKRRGMTATQWAEGHGVAALHDMALNPGVAEARGAKVQGSKKAFSDYAKAPPYFKAALCEHDLPPSACRKCEEDWWLHGPKPVSPLKDSGVRREAGTGAVRDRAAGKGRFDLNPTQALYRLASHMELGAAKYSDRNWEAGMPLSWFADAATRHTAKYIAGYTDEDHLAAALWNLACIAEGEERIRLGLWPAELDDLPHTFAGKEPNF